MKKTNINKGMVGIIALVVVMVTALALSMNGKSLQGYLNLRSVSPVATPTLTRERPTTTAVRQAPTETTVTTVAPTAVPNNNGNINTNLEDLNAPVPMNGNPSPSNLPFTNADLMKLVVNASGVPSDTTGAPHFKDVPTDSWFYSYVETAYNNGWINAGPDNMFHPGDLVNRGYGAKVFYWALLQKCHDGLPPISSSSPQYYKDVPWNTWYAEYVRTMADCKMVDILSIQTPTGPKTNFYPSEILSRARAEYMVNNAKKAGWVK